jgi:hypothetical protein
MNNQWDKIFKKVVMSQLNNYPSICLEELKKTMKDLSQDVHSPG